MWWLKGGWFVGMQVGLGNEGLSDYHGGTAALNDVGNTGHVRGETQGSEADQARWGRLAKDSVGRLQPLGTPCRTRASNSVPGERTPVRFCNNLPMRGIGLVIMVDGARNRQEGRFSGRGWRAGGLKASRSFLARSSRGRCEHRTWLNTKRSFPCVL